MSYDIRLMSPATHKVIEFDSPHQMRGGLYCIGGTTEAWLNITYNYADWYYKDGVFPDYGDHRSGIRSIYDKTGAESIPILQHAINALEAMTEDISPEERAKCEVQGATGYWTPTRVNAIAPLYQLLAMAKMRPDGVWDGD